MKELYVDSKIFHFNHKMKDLLDGNLSSPIHIRLKPTNKCNHRCFYCCYRSDNLYLSELVNEADEIPRDKMKEIIADLKDMDVKAVTFSGGGEPLFYPYIEEAVKGLVKAGIKVALLTNGALLSGNIARILSLDAAWVRISMDASDAQAYSRTRGVGLKEFDIVCDNIRNFANIKGKQCELGINLIVNKENYKDIFKFLNLAKKLGADHVKISECVVSTKSDKNKKYIKSFSDSVKKQIRAGIATLSDSNFAIIDKFSDLNTNNSYKKEYQSCPFAQCLTVVAADMNVYTCQDKAYTKKGKIGSIKNNSFRKLWFSKETKNKLFNLNPRKECSHHCTQHGKNMQILEYVNVNDQHLEFV